MKTKSRKHERTDANVSRKREILRKIKKHCNRNEEFFDMFISRHDMAKKESVNLKIGQQQLPKLTCCETKDFSKQNRHSTTVR